MFDSIAVSRFKEKLEKANADSASFMKEIDNSMIELLPGIKKKEGAFEQKVKKSSKNNSRNSKERSA